MNIIINLDYFASIYQSPFLKELTEIFADLTRNFTHST
jgi:hypothetical protein